MTHFEYPTTDIVLAAVLKINGYRLKKIDLFKGTKGVFYFEQVGQTFLDSFNTGNVRVEPSAFHSEIKSLSIAIARMKGVN